MSLDWLDIAVRFVFGGSAVVASYLVSLFVPWKSFAGIFAAFPAVMAAAVILTGCKQGSAQAGEVAFGAVAGMLGCTFCVVGAVLLSRLFQNWAVGLFLSLFVWLGAAVFFNNLTGKMKKSGQDSVRGKRPIL
ncbi:DUF3147 family protein [Zhaonella formicivorans]|uniref:DUF3147 family protein n=1 Tax=Zhaonella formicivorans TaxID=2528593 RepID=UPI0010CFD847|nr:DUF3147 family protein [Zhaonella formicivorans]